MQKHISDNKDNFGVLDRQIETIMGCTPLPEAEVKVLAEKVRRDF